MHGNSSAAPPERHASRVGATARFAVIHFVVSLSAFAWSYSVVSDAFDGRPVSWVSRHLATPLAQALWFPLVPLADMARPYGFRPSPAIQWFLLGANSALWGLAASGLARRFRRRTVDGGP